MLLTEIFAPKIATKIRENAEKKHREYINNELNELKERISNTPKLQENINNLVIKHGINKYDQRIFWNEETRGAIINIKFQDPVVMRQILNSTKLKPDELVIFEGRLDDCGLPGSVSFFAQDIEKEVKVEMTYDNYLWGHGGFVLRSGENWQDFGYEKVEKPELMLEDLWKLK